MTAHPWLLIALCLLCAPPGDPVCHHPDRGDSRPAALDRVAAAQKDLQQRMAAAWDQAPRLTAESSFDCGLPSCRTRQTRRVRTILPRDFVGRSVVFAPADRMPPADVRVVTSARRVSEIDAEAMADPRLIERLQVRCTPTLVHAISEVELELVENP
jgi:hypothetical protein